MLLLSASPASAATITVDASCTLHEAIEAANSDATVSGCNAGSGADEITLTADYSLASDEELPKITTDMTINGDNGSGGRYTITGVNRYEIFNHDAGSLTVKNLRLINGRAFSGPAVNSAEGSGSLTIINSVFSENRAEEFGGFTGTVSGGAISTALPTTITNSIFANNYSESAAGAIYADDDLTITNTLFYGNRSKTHEGGALSIQSPLNPPIRLRHVTMVNNQSDANLGALAIGGVLNLFIENSIIANNRGGNCYIVGTGTFTLQGNNIIPSPGPCGSANNLAVQPLLSSSYKPSLCSPAIDAASESGCQAAGYVDLDGTTRPQGNACDIGAYESPSGVCPDTSSSSGSSTSKEDTYKPTVSTCSTLDGISASNISESTQCQRVNAMQIANPAIKDGDFVDAVDVWGWVTPNSEICFEASGSAIKFIDTAAMPRATTDLIAYSRQDTVCASINGPGILVLLPGDAPPAGSQQSASRKLSGCMVRLTEKLNFRETPGGEIMEVLSKDAKLTAVERTDGWFKVDFWGKKGWVSAEWVAPEGDCG